VNPIEQLPDETTIQDRLVEISEEADYLRQLLRLVRKRPKPISRPNGLKPVLQFGAVREGGAAHG
jgi:hypothetical protein